MSEFELDPGHDQSEPEGANSPAHTDAVSKSEYEALMAKYRSAVASANGLNGRVKVLSKELDEVKATLQTASTGYETRIAELTQQLEQTQKGFSEMESQFRTIHEERDKLVSWRNTREAVRKYAIENNAQQLLELFDDGLLIGLDSLDEAQRTEYFGKMASKFGNSQKKLLDEIKGGVTPKPPSQQKTLVKSTDEMLADLTTLARTKGASSPEYIALLEEYQQALATEDSQR